MSPELEKEFNEHYQKFCDRFNEHLPCKSQEDVDAIYGIDAQMRKEANPDYPEPNVYWDRKFFTVNEFDSKKCWNELFSSSNVKFFPSDDMEEHPGVTVRYIEDHSKVAMNALVRYTEGVDKFIQDLINKGINPKEQIISITWEGAGYYRIFYFK